MGEDDNPVFTKMCYTTGVADFFKKTDKSNRAPGWMNTQERSEWQRGWHYGRNQAA